MLRRRGARELSEAADDGVRLAFYLCLLAVGQLHGHLELGGRVGVSITGDDLSISFSRRERNNRKKHTTTRTLFFMFFMFFMILSMFS